MDVENSSLENNDNDAEINLNYIMSSMTEMKAEVNRLKELQSSKNTSTPIVKKIEKLNFDLSKIKNYHSKCLSEQTQINTTTNEDANNDEDLSNTEQKGESDILKQKLADATKELEKAKVLLNQYQERQHAGDRHLGSLIYMQVEIDVANRRTFANRIDNRETTVARLGRTSSNEQRNELTITQMLQSSIKP